jgi:hypothetical protein
MIEDILWKSKDWSERKSRERRDEAQRDSNTEEKWVGETWRVVADWVMNDLPSLSWIMSRGGSHRTEDACDCIDGTIDSESDMRQRESFELSE